MTTSIHAATPTSGYMEQLPARVASPVIRAAAELSKNDE